MVASFPNKVLLLFTVLLFANLCSGSLKRSVDEHKQLILDGSSVFSNAKDLTGFEIFEQEFDGQKTIYKSLDKPSFTFTHPGNDVSSADNVIILDPSENIPRKTKTMYVVLRRRLNDTKTFTSHLVYIRELKGQTSLEWDYFLSDESKDKWSFAKAFSPEKFLDSVFGDSNIRVVRDVMAAPGLPTKIIWKDSSEEVVKKKKKKKEESEEEEEDKGHKKKKKHKKEESEEEEAELPPDCKEDKKPKRRKRKQPKVVYKININHIICASGGDCKPDPCLGKGKKPEEKAKGRSMFGFQSLKKGILIEGFGICPKLEPPPKTLEKPLKWTGENELISTILQTLRVQCIPQAITQIKEFFSKKMVISDEKFHLELNTVHPLFNLKAPGMGEWSDISGALYFKVYSNTYFEEAEKMAENERIALSPNKQPISSTVEILTTITHKIIRYFKGLFEPHIIKLIKTLEVILQTDYADNLKHKEDEPKATNLNDRIQLLCLYKLLNLEKIDEILTKDLNVDTAFGDLYNESLAVLTAAAEKSSPLEH